MSKEALLKQIEENVKNCQKCRLYQGATNPVPGEGNINSKIIFIGEAPGEMEDKSGRPFVGRAGKLLEAALAKIGYKREDIWIGNIIKHRPPNNRDPLPDELSVCRKYLDLQLEAISPTLVVTLGRFSMNYFLPEAKISRDRGNFVKCGKFYVYPVYHPAAALRSPAMMQDFVKDFVRIPLVLSEIEKLAVGNVENSENKDQLGLGL